MLPAHPHRRPHFPIAEAELVALFMQSIAFGAHAVTFVLCMHRWFRRSKMPGLNSKSWPWAFVAVTLFIIGAMDVVFNLGAFVFRGPAGASSHCRMISGWISIVRVSCLPDPCVHSQILMLIVIEYVVLLNSTTFRCSSGTATAKCRAFVH